MDDLPAPYLLSLPLHAVTEVYGEAGLRRRFSLELSSFAEAEQVVLQRALRLASRLHREDRRTREPVINHLLRVTLRIMCHYRVRDVEVLAAALLHDSVEDHPRDLAGGEPEDSTSAALGVLARDFGARVAWLVGAVTNPQYDPARDKDEQYREHLVASLGGEPWARLIKVSDFTDNGAGVLYTIGPKVRRAATKYRAVVPLLRELVARPDTPLHDEVKAHIAGQFDRAERRFAAILQPS
ncbi:HD domain-containing protein [Pseudonocardia sp. CA-107938]|uniref:HD domain-containing protein n=1 Tax=Pseudonocardia sp. CA-107938 TaxID=3240021 RepID=UPI003D8DF520